MSPCQCAGCLLGRLQGTASILARGQAGMAARTLASIIFELEVHVAASRAAPASPHKRTKPAGPATSIRRAQRLARLLADCPALRAVAASALKVRPADVTAISEGRVLLTAQRWQRLFDAVDPPERPAGPIQMHGDVT